MEPERRELLLLLEIHTQNEQLFQKVGKLMDVTEELSAGVDAVKTAVTDAANAIKDLAAKLGNASSIHPGDVEAAALKLNTIAAGLEAVVTEAGEPITEPVPVPAPTPDPAPADPSEAIPAQPSAPQE